MKSILVSSIFFIVIFFDSAPAKWYSRALQEKWVVDSLKRIDSVRVADSARVADSLTVARYEESDSVLAKEKIREEAEKKATPVTPVVLDTGVIPIPGQVDNVSGRAIVIDPANPYAAAIDSLQKKIESLNNALHDSDSRLKEMKSFPVSEKKRYLFFLLQNKMKDTSAVVAYCNSLFEIYKIKHDLLLAIKASQDPNTKSFIQYHIEEHKRKMADLSNFVLALTPKVPFLPQRDRRKKITEQ